MIDNKTNIMNADSSIYYHIFLRVLLVFGLPITAIGIAFVAWFPQRFAAVAISLILIESVGVVLMTYRAFEQRQTGLEWLFVPPMIVLISLGNLLAIPVGRKIRSFFSSKGVSGT